MGGSSKSSTSSTTQNINEDSRTAGGEIGSITIGAGAEYSNEFGPEVAAAFNKLVDLAQASIHTAEGVSTLATETVANRTDRSEKGSLTAFTDALPVISGVAIVGFLAWAAISIFKGK